MHYSKSQSKDQSYPVHEQKNTVCEFFNLEEQTKDYYRGFYSYTSEY